MISDKYPSLSESNVLSNSELDETLGGACAENCKSCEEGCKACDPGNKRKVPVTIVVNIGGDGDDDVGTNHDGKPMGNP